MSIKNILNDIKLFGFPNRIYKIKYQIRRVDIEYIIETREFILETDRNEIIFKSNIKNYYRKKKNIWKDGYYLIKDLINSGKIVESNPIDYIYSCIKYRKISLQFLLSWIDKKMFSINSESNKVKNLILLDYELLV